jgi:2'-5' RNA ligase
MQLPDRHSRFLIAILPPAELQAEVTVIKQVFADKYQSKGALKSPPHITLHAPFVWAEDRLSELEHSLKSFACDREPFVINLSNFAAFPPRVIYLDVLANHHLDLLHRDLLHHCDRDLQIIDQVAANRKFVPHMTVAFRDLKQSNFDQAWLDFQDREFTAQWQVQELTLLMHNGQRWEVKSQFEIGGIKC